MRRRRQAFAQLLQSLKPAELEYLRKRLPTHKAPGSQHFADDFARALADRDAENPGKLPSKRRLRLHEAIIEELTYQLRNSHGEPLVLFHLRQAHWLRERGLYRQAMVELVRTRELAAHYELSLYLPLLHTHIQDLLRFMVMYGDYRPEDMDLLIPDFHQHQQELLQQLNRESRVYDKLFKFFWLKLELGEENPIESREKSIAALRPVEGLQTSAEHLGSVLRSSLVGAIASLYYTEGRYAESLELVEQMRQLTFRRPQPWPSELRMRFLFIFMNQLLLNVLLGRSEAFQQLAEEAPDFARETGMNLEEQHQLNFEVYLRQLQLATVLQSPALAREALARPAVALPKSGKQMVTQKFLELYQANAQALQGHYRAALKTLTPYQAKATGQDTLLEVYVGLLRMGCKIALAETDSLPLVFRQLRRPLTTLAEEPYFAGLLALFQHHPGQTRELVRRWQQHENHYQECYYARLTRANSAGFWVAAQAAATP